jgi:N-acetylmuramoyl-L-alanine amidase
LFKAASKLTLHTARATACAVICHGRPKLTKHLLWIALLVACAAHAATAVKSVRVWPAQDYTRITIEAAAPITHELLLLKNPERLALDLQDVEVTPALQELAGKIGANDPYVKAVRVGRFKPGVVRLVFDLKTEAKPDRASLPS